MRGSTQCRSSQWPPLRLDRVLLQAAQPGEQAQSPQRPCGLGQPATPAPGPHCPVAHPCQVVAFAPHRSPSSFCESLTRSGSKSGQQKLFFF